MRLVELRIAQHLGIDISADHPRNFALQHANRAALGRRPGAQVQQDGLRRGLVAYPSVKGNRAVTTLVRIKSIEGVGRYHVTSWTRRGWRFCANSKSLKTCLDTMGSRP